MTPLDAAPYVLLGLLALVCLLVVGMAWLTRDDDDKADR
jgi:hypothetical protein